ncbi:hypothetical protein B6U74_05765 [Candidatus Bathyarchaeota archaeon ex4484_205]|nr:MAG: hypothetical protein B6U74_05765 [Candidatus Bathyarchaeota archaeon ex4484_205]
MKVTVVGAVGIDEHIKIEDVRYLPSPFKKYIKKTLAYSQIQEVYGPEWTVEKVFGELKERAIEPVIYSYGGRAPHVAYGLAKLENKASLVTTFGGDYNEAYPGFFGGGYLEHLIRAGVEIQHREIGIPEKIWRKPEIEDYLKEKLGKELYEIGVLVVTNKKTSKITCVKDKKGNDFFYIDDINGASIVEKWREAPTQLISNSNIIFITSSETSFMQRNAKEAYTQGKRLLVDIGSYGITSEYIKEVVPKAEIIMGNPYEIEQILQTDSLKSIEEIFTIDTKYPKYILIENKIEGYVDIYARGEIKKRIGPVKLQKKGNSVGCCDAIATGVISGIANKIDIETSVAIGLLEASSVWDVEGVQEGMLDKNGLIKRAKENIDRLGKDIVQTIIERYS